MASLTSALDRNLALELVRATEAAAIRAYPWIGNGDKNAADGAAVDAMRSSLAGVEIRGRIVIGEGEKDDAPMLFNGERVGAWTGPAIDIAVDPIDGTSLTAAGRPNALSVIAASGEDTMLDVSAVFYMNKIVTGPEGRGVVDLRQSVMQNLTALARVKKKALSELQVAVLDRPRHIGLIEEVRATGARTRLMLDGDVAGGINAARYDSPIDICIGVGGSPEGITTACAVKALNGYMQVQLAPTDVLELERAGSAGLDVNRVWDADELVRGENTLFVCTGVTDGDLVRGVRKFGNKIRTESLVIRGRSGTIRRIVADHRLERWSV